MNPGVRVALIVLVAECVAVALAVALTAADPLAVPTGISGTVVVVAVLALLVAPLAAGGWTASVARRANGLAARVRPEILTGTDFEADYERLFGVVADRLELRRRELRESEHLLRLLMDALPLAVAYLDRDLRYRLTNKTVEDWFGLGREEMAGRTLRDVLGAEAFALAEPNILQTRGGQSNTYEMMMPYRFGGERYVVTTIVPHLDEDGEVQGHFVAVHDMSERKKAEDAVRVARDAAQTADTEKTRFLAAASHDLRQPLHAMRLLTGVLADRTRDTPELKIVDDLVISLQSIEGMLNALLNISQFDSGAMQPEVEAFPLEDVLHRIEREFAPQASEQGLDFRVVPSSVTVVSDTSLLERIVGNFVANAIRYTAEGGILLGCRRGDGCVRIEVWDTGIGIPDEQIGSIFEEYYQIGNPARDRSRGLGLGLALVERMARSLGHRIECRSVPGKGSMFGVEVPTGIRPAAIRDAVAAAGPRPLAGRRVLVVEDDEMGLRAMREWLHAIGARVDAAANRDQVMRRIGETGYQCDLMIADHRLPDGDTGAAIVREVRDRLARDVPAVIVTGDTAADIRSEAESLGCGFLRKPIDPDALLNLANRLMAAHSEDLADAS